MAKENILLDKSYNFALRIVKLYKYLVEEKKEYVLSKQILKSGTSIGANINEAQSGETMNDFIHNLGISLKELKETSYWLRLLKDSGYIEEKSFNSIYKDNEEILKIITKIIKTSRKNNEKTKDNNS
ncbi:MAG: four helix bundle protein [FCB group bacterium]|jgi:four helix bundle protein